VDAVNVLGPFVVEVVPAAFAPPTLEKKPDVGAEADAAAVVVEGVAVAGGCGKPPALGLSFVWLAGIVGLVNEKPAGAADAAGCNSGGCSDAELCEGNA